MTSRGIAHTVRSHDLKIVLGLEHDSDPARTIRVLVNELTAQGVPIGSTNFESGGGGYFIVTTDMELAKCVRNYQSRARENLRKAERLTRAYRFGPSQPSLLADE